MNISDIDYIIYYEKPLITFERLLETYLALAPRGSRSFIAAMQVWLKEKLFLKTSIKKELKEIQKLIADNNKQLLSSRTSFFRTSFISRCCCLLSFPFEEAVVLRRRSWGMGNNFNLDWKNHIEPLWEISFPHSWPLFSFHILLRIQSEFW